MNCKICPHCKTYSDANNIKCAVCGMNLPNVIYDEDQLKDEFKTSRKYIERKLSLYGLFSEFKKLLANEYNIRRNDEKNNITYNVIMEHFIYQTQLNSSVKERYLQYANKLNNFKNMPENQFKELVYNDAKQIFFNMLKNKGIKFNIYKHIPEHTVPVTVIKNKHGAGTKMVATGLFGVVGLAGTNGVKQQTVNQIVPARDEIEKNVNIILNEDNISIQFIDEEHGKLPKNTYNWNQITEMDSDNYLKSDEFEPILLIDFDGKEIIQSIENIYFKFLVESHKLREIIDYGEIKGLLINDFKKYINNHAYGKYVNKNIDEAKELEEFYNLKERGIISEREYQNKKNEILGINTNTNTKIGNKNFCPNCGSKIVDKNNNYCTECGFKLE
ncbi:hypothetical protein BGI41_06035 [Methanobrevibacter sp. 87.7]|uniref:zinc-ribbon domain-containing protein n=1 Tax=Methanobrevibacter sp. 87.7 TaxID=387957 RepID=UPI000B506BC4|nr:zinc-ribbon domain-containing protein [Methanobrevibacter sp. 87.7]OWT32751.1 hypothetical protein BGI41_06035 [Methanobrevibacter sp. 87.7]